MATLPIDSSTVSTLSVVCAALVFVFAFSSGVKPAAALLIAIVVGFVLKAIGVIPIGLMAIVALSLVVGIFKNLMGRSSNDNSPQQDNLTTPIDTQENNKEGATLDEYAQDFLSQEAAVPEGNSKEPLNSIVVERLDSKTGEWQQLNTEKPIKLNDANRFEVFAAIAGMVALLSFAGYMAHNKDEVADTSHSNYSSSNSVSQATDTTKPPVTTNQPVVTAPTETPINPMLMQQCDAYATAHKRKEFTLTFQEQRDDYDKLYEFCLSEAKRPTQATPVNSINAESVQADLVQAYQAARIDNETSRRYLNKTWEDLTLTLPDNAKASVLKKQRVWIKSKRTVCGKIESVAKSNAVNNLMPEELEDEIELLECDSQANTERAALLSNSIDEVAKIIKNNNDK